MNFRGLAKILILCLGLASTSLFVLPKIADAALILPSTSCDDEQITATANYSSVHLIEGMAREDGTKAFNYGNENSFVSKTGNIITFTVVLRFAPDSPFKGSIKLMGMSEDCNVIFGLGPVFHNLEPLAANNLTYDVITGVTSLGDNVEYPQRMGKVRYVWVEVWDGNKPSNFASYSYLIDLENIENPSGTIDEPPQQPNGRRPVLIIPGIMGSELYEGGELIWPNISRIILSSSDNFLSDGLVMDDRGISIKNIKVGEIITKLPATDTFESLLTTLSSNGYGENISLFSYDWRMDLDQNKFLINNKIETIKNDTGYDKVDVIAHSMGGLLLQNYIDEYRSESINKIIYVGTPHLGAPKAAYALLQGDIGVPLRFLNYEAIRDISRNSPATYQLLPNKIYHQLATGYFRKRNGQILTYNQSSKLLEDQGLNKSLIQNSDFFFEKALSTVDTTGIEVYNLSGCGKATHGIYHIDDNGAMYGISYLNGDGTVPLISSININATKKYYVKNGKHSELPSTVGVKELILSILKDEAFEASNISSQNTFCNLKGKKLTWRSPVEVHIYDLDNNHAGPIEGGFENNIPGVSYDIVDGEKFIFLPTDDSQEYRIEGTGEETGSFDLLITDVENEIEGETSLFDNIEIVFGSLVTFTVTADSNNINICLASEGLTGSRFDSEDEAFIEAMFEPVMEQQPEPDKDPVLESGSDVKPVSGTRAVGGPPPLGHYNEKNGIILGEAIVRLEDGSLILDSSDGRTVYIIYGGKKYGFTSEEVFTGRGYRFRDILFIGHLSDYESEGLIVDTATNIKDISSKI